MRGTDGVVDHLTLEAARRGDRQAISTLLRSLQDPWYRMALGLLGGPELARDAVQETAARFLRQLPAFRGESQLRTWSLGICLNVVRELRRADRHCRAMTEYDDGSGQSRDPSPADAAERAEEIQSLRTTLARLPDRQREALILRYFEGLSIDQTARAMQCASGTVKATIHQALRALRGKLRTTDVGGRSHETLDSTSPAASESRS